MNRCRNTGIVRTKPFLALQDAQILRREVDAFIDKKILEWNASVPYAEHFQNGKIDQTYYKRHLIETALRIRLLRVAESKALAEIAKISPEGAKIWANYEMEEMVHDELFLNDLQAAGADLNATLRATEPYLSTKLLAGFFSYLLDHEGPLGVVAYSYLVEYVNVKLDPEKIKGLKDGLGEEQIQGQISHTHTDDVDDHPGEVWEVVRRLIRSPDDIASFYRYLEEHQRILVMFFEEIYAETVLKKEAA